MIESKSQGRAAEPVHLQDGSIPLSDLDIDLNAPAKYCSPEDVSPWVEHVGRLNTRSDHPQIECNSPVEFWAGYWSPR